MSLDAREAWQVFSSDPQPEHTANVSLAAHIRTCRSQLPDGGVRHGSGEPFSAANPGSCLPNPKNSPFQRQSVVVPILMEGFGGQGLNFSSFPQAAEHVEKS
jgi:hypothetical protein